MAKTVYILKHVAGEGGGTIVDFLKARGVSYREIALYDGDALPKPEDVSEAVIMGGPMNVYEEDKHPFLKAENAFVQTLLRRGTPCLGVCLGAQLIAKALGAKVYKAARPETGWDDVTLSPEAARDRLFSLVQAPALRVLQWHEDTFDLPAGAALLASSQAVPHQAYRVGENVYGLQFHVEVKRAMIEEWFSKRQDLPGILKTYEEYKERLDRLTAAMFGRFFRVPISEYSGKIVSSKEAT